MALFNRRRREDDERTIGGGVAEFATEDDSIGVIEALFASPIGPATLPPLTDLAPLADPVPLDHDPASTDHLGRGSSPRRIGIEEERARMANLDQSVQDLLAIDGATGAVIVDSGSGMALAEGGHPGFDLGIAAAGNSNVVRAKLQTMRDLGLTASIEDILITLDQQYHLINVLHGGGNDGLFVYLVLDRARANLALARHKLTQVAGQIQI